MVCEWFGLKTTQMVFTGLASKPVMTVFTSLASKLVATVSPNLASKPVIIFLVEPQNQCGGGFSSLGLKTGNYEFGDLGIKITTMVSLFRPQNQASFDLSVAPQNR
jgi:hypothetical protein